MSTYLKSNYSKEKEQKYRKPDITEFKRGTKFEYYMELLKKPWRIGILQRDPNEGDLVWLNNMIYTNRIRIKK